MMGKEVIEVMDKLTKDWTMRAAKGECAWVCADCCASFPEGMPDECLYDNERCNRILKRDKDEANNGI
jgi:hypothetical protein